MKNFFFFLMFKKKQPCQGLVTANTGIIGFWKLSWMFDIFLSCGVTAS